MELKLEQGRYVTGLYTGLETVSQKEELLQRISMKLRARRGEFLPMPDFGSRLHELLRIKPSQRPSAARQFVQEALSDEQGLYLESIELSDKGEGELQLTMSFDYRGDELYATISL